MKLKHVLLSLILPLSIVSTVGISSCSYKPYVYLKIVTNEEGADDPKIHVIAGNTDEDKSIDYVWGLTTEYGSVPTQAITTNVGELMFDPTQYISHPNGNYWIYVTCAYPDNASHIGKINFFVPTIED